MVARAEERRQEIERQIDTMMKRFVEHIDEQIDRLEESVDCVWQDTQEWNNIIRYLKICSNEEYNAIYYRARHYLDHLPDHEKSYAQKTLDYIIESAKLKNDSVPKGNGGKNIEKEI